MGCLELALPLPPDGGPPGDGGGPEPADAGTPAAEVTLLVPPPDTPAPANLRWVVLEFAVPVAVPAGGVAVVDGAGTAVEALLRPAGGELPACGARPPDGCAVLELLEELAPQTEYQVALSAAVVTVSGSPPVVDSAALRFTTGAGRDEAAPEGALAVAASDGCLVARVAAGELVFAELELLPLGPGDELGAPGDGLAAAHELAAVWAEAPAGARFEAAVTLWDLAGNERVLLGDEEVVAAPPPGWAVSEVLANPAGAEPAQEWIELVRLGAEPGSLAGLRISDGAGQDVLPDVVVAPGGRALVVPAGYDAAAPGDVAPPAGTPLARIEGTTLGQNGLANAGETITLLDEGGAAISVFTSYYDVSSSAWAGRSVERVRPGGCDVRANTAPNTGRTATPGAPNSVEP